MLFLIRQPVRDHDEIRIAQRLFLNGDDVQDLPTVLAVLTDRAWDYYRAGITHPLPYLADTTEACDVELPLSRCRDLHRR